MTTLSPSQDKACDAFLQFIRDPDRHEFLLKGAAGTGKSFLVTYLLDLVRDEHKLIKLISPHTPAPNFVFTATTNKAANVLSQMVYAPAQTIHQVLGLSVTQNYNTGKAHLVQKNDTKALNHSILIVDEGSMINQDLLRHIQKARKGFRDCKVLYVGDSYQLPPIGENTCPIFHKTETIAELTDIVRQAKGSPIIGLSHMYREILDNPEREWPVIPHDGDIINHYTDAKPWKQAILDAYQKDHHPDDLRVLAWSNGRVRDYNEWIRTKLGFDMPYQVGETMLCNSTITVGNRVRASTDSLHKIVDWEPITREGIDGHLITVTSYDGGDYLKVFQPDNWAQATQLLKELASLAKSTHSRIERNQTWKQFWDIKNTWGDFRPIHAQTVHKSQGSTYREVFIDLADVARNNKWYEVARLMYVAITRASLKVHLYGNLAERYTRADPMAKLRKFQNEHGNTFT